MSEARFRAHGIRRRTSHRQPSEVGRDREEPCAASGAAAVSAGRVRSLPLALSAPPRSSGADNSEGSNMPIAPTWPAELGRSSNRKLASTPLSCFNELLPKDVCYPVAEPSSGRSGSCGLQPVQHVSREVVEPFQLRLHRAKPALGKGRCNAVLARGARGAGHERQDIAGLDQRGRSRSRRPVVMRTGRRCWRRRSPTCSLDTKRRTGRLKTYVSARHTAWAVIRPVLRRILATTAPKMNPPTWAKNATPLSPVFEGWISA